MTMPVGILGIQILGVFFGLFMIYLTFIKFKQKHITKNSFLMFIVVFCGFIFMSFFPTILDPLLATLHFKRRLDFFIILGFIFLITLVYYSHITIISLNKKMESVVREIAFVKQENEELKTEKSRK